MFIETIAKLKKSIEKNTDNIIVNILNAVRLVRFVTLKKIPPASLNITKLAKNGIKRAIKKEREENKIRTMCLK
jgi:hypothetical protein